MTLEELLESLETSGYTLLGTCDNYGTYGDDSLVKRGQLVYKIDGNILHEQSFKMIATVDESEAWFFGGFDPTEDEVEEDIRIYLDGLAKGFYATGVLSFSGQVSDGDTVTIDTKTYTFKTTLTDVDGYVLIGSDASDSAWNIVSAINGFVPGRGNVYAESTTIHTTVTSLRNGDTVEVKAKQRGVGGNSISTTETSSQLSWGSSTLTGGTAPVIEGYAIETIDYEYQWAIVKFYETSGGVIDEDRYFVDKDTVWQHRNINIKYQ